MVFNPGPGTPGPQSPRAHWILRRRPAERRVAGPPFRQANQGVQFPIAVRPASSQRRNAPVRIRQGHCFLPGWGQANQGVPFPLFADAAGSKPRWPPRISRGKCFLPGWGQSPQGTRFPLAVRQAPGRRFAARQRRPRIFFPPWPPGLASPWTHYARQAGPAPRWRPPPRFNTGRVAGPPFATPARPAPWPLFTRQHVRLTALPGRIHAARVAWTQRLPATQLGALPLHASGSMSMAAYLGRPAALPLTATSHLGIAATRQTFAQLSLHATGAWHLAAVNAKPGALAPTASGHMTIAASVTRAAVITLRATAHYSAAGTVTRPAAFTPMRATGHLGIAGTPGRLGTMHLTASGHLGLAAKVTKDAKLAMGATGHLSVAAVSSPSLPLRATGHMGVAADAVRAGVLAMSASGSMGLRAWAGPPGMTIVIVPGAVSSPAEITEEGTYAEVAPPDEPDRIHVEDIEPGY